jgi:hypothetical protein
MKNLLAATALLLAIAPAVHAAETLSPPAPLGKGATKAYRQVLPDGSILYSDKPVKGAKIAETIEVEPPSKHAPLAVDADRKPAARPRPHPVPVRKVAKVPPPDRRMTADEAQSEVVRAEMQLEDAKRRQQAGAEPQPGERTGNAGGGSRLNEYYWQRQKELAQDVERAREELRRAESERDTLLPVH